MKKSNKKNELDVDFIQNKPLTEDEQIAFRCHCRVVFVLVVRSRF